MVINTERFLKLSYREVYSKILISKLINSNQILFKVIYHRDILSKIIFG